MPEKIDYKKLFEANVKIASYPSFDMNGFLELFLREVLILTKSRRGFVFANNKAKQRVLEISGSDLFSAESTGNPLPQILRLENDSSSADVLSITGRIRCNQKCRLYLSDKDLLIENTVDRYLSAPLEEDNHSPFIVLVADKKTDYSLSDFSILIKMSGLAARTIENLKITYDLKQKSESEAEELKIKNSFIRFISHEIKRPLNSITGFSLLLREENQSAESCKKFTDIILYSTHKLMRFINSINDISDIETGLIKTVESEVNLCYLFSEIYEQFKSEANHKKLQFNIQNEIPDADLVIFADREKVKRVIRELLSNSFQHTFTGTVSAGCVLNDGAVEFFVTDTGTGISDEQKSKLFCNFLDSGDSFVKSSEGSGLGLTISKEYVEHMGGRIWFDSSEDIGTSFFFSIPYKKYVKENVSDIIMEKRVPERTRAKNGHKVFAHTAYANDIATALEMDCDDFVAKSFLREEPITMIKSYVKSFKAIIKKGLPDSGSPSLT